jgi:protein-disulfide isomerase
MLAAWAIGCVASVASISCERLATGAGPLARTEEARFAAFEATAENEVRIVVFVDVECAACRSLVPQYIELVRQLESEAPRPTVALEMRHFPLEGECNPFWLTTAATLGCEAAAVIQAKMSSEPAAALTTWRRLLEGTPPPSLEALLRISNVEIAEFRIQYQELLTQVSADAELGGVNGVMATPTVFVNGLRLRAPAANELLQAIRQEASRLSSATP